MTEHRRSLTRILARRVAWPLRRVIAPGALEVPGLTAELERLWSALAESETRFEQAESRAAALEHRLHEAEKDLQEARRMNIRVAELTDVVTELVLPLHDRELDPAALLALRPEPR